MSERNDSAYREYLDRVRQHLEARGVRLLTEKEEAIVVNHLEGVVLAFANDPKNSIRAVTVNGVKRVGVENSLRITQVLGIETAKKVSEIHEEFSNLSPESYDRKVAEVLAVRNYLKDDECRTP